MMRGGYTLRTNADKDLVRDIKATMCYLACDYYEKMEKYKKSGDLQEVQELSDRRKINIGIELYKAPKIIFQSNLVELFFFESEHYEM